MNYMIILAGGAGKRMHQPQDTIYPKCLYPIFRKPMVFYSLDLCDDLNNYGYNIKPITVIKYKKELFKEALDERSIICEQIDNLNGNGAAFYSIKDIIKDKEGFSLIIPADKVLLNKYHIKRLIDVHLKDNNDITFIETIVNYNSKYGRVIKDDKGNILKISERHLKKYDKRNKIGNTSIYCINNKVLDILINNLKIYDNEMYLSEIVEIGNMHKLKVSSIFVKESMSFKGINTMVDVGVIEGILRNRINYKLMKNGVNIINPNSVVISNTSKIESGVVIHPNTYITGSTTIKKGAIIGPNTEIHDSIIGCDSIVKHSLVYDSIIGDNTTIGPFSHLRQFNKIGNNIRIGNFVEIKKSEIDNFTKISHLTYVGDSIVGKRVNFGCGVVTVNYDGKHKYLTKIGDNVFIGCNSNLIAPIEVNDNSYIAAGSTITNNIPKDSMSIARSYQITKEGYAKKYPYFKN